MKKLIVCADDFAAYESASAGIVQLADAGRISATSAMVLSPRWPQDALRLDEARGRIDVGLHLDWTSEFAVAAGHGMKLSGAMLRSMATGFDTAAARTVIDRQLDAFEAHWNGPPDHIDGHQHVQQFAGIREALLDCITRRYRRARPWLRVSRPPTGQRDLKGMVIAAMGANALERQAREAGIACAPALSGVYDFQGGGERYAALMAHWLASAPEGTVLMCHPAQSAIGGDAIGQARAGEFGFLASDGFAQALETAQVRLARGGDFGWR